MIDTEKPAAPQARQRAEQDYLDCLFAEPSQHTAAAAAHDDTAVTGSASEAGAAQPLMCQLIMVAGIRLALPQPAFTQVLSCPADLGADADMQVLLAARLRHDGRDIDVLNLRPLLLSAQRLADVAPPGGRDAAILLLQHSGAGLLCDSVESAIEVNPLHLCRRDAGSRWTWLAATARTDGYALLDVDGLGQLLQQHALSRNDVSP